MSYFKKDNKDDLSKKLSEKDLIQKDNNSYVVFKKIERVTAAVYLVSDLLPEEEPLKVNVRNAGLATLKCAGEWGTREHNSERARTLISSIAHLMSLLSVGVLSGYISRMNRTLIDKELRDILTTIYQTQDAGNKYVHALEFESSFFGTSAHASDHERAHGLEYPHLKKGELWESLEGDALRTHREHTTKDAPKSSRRGAFPKEGNTDPDGRMSLMDRDARRLKVVETVKSRGRVSVKDVAAIITDCSEKTLQRELLALVSQGVLKKEGERRWSTYVLAS